MYHALDHYEVLQLDDWYGQAVNHMIGLPVEGDPLQGSMVLVPLSEGQSNHAEREHQRRYFEMLDAVDVGFCTVAEAGIGALH